MNYMDIDSADESSGDAPVELQLMPVELFESGEGLPYAPENWPRSGDIWRWKVGDRVNNNGYFSSRYLYPPKRLNCGTLVKGGALASKIAVERFIKAMFPKQDLRKFFASFSWKIPYKVKSGNPQEHTTVPISVEDSDEDPPSDRAACKAGNRKCRSLLTPKENSFLATMPCDICCSEPKFCLECCCVLCCKPISLEHGGYSYIKCEAVVNEGYICGHSAHVNCALRSHMAGTVGGYIGLDAEYYCRRCDAKTDLVPHVNGLLEICDTVDSEDDVEKILNVGICLLRGSQKSSADKLLNCIESAMIKLKCGTHLEDVWNKEEESTIWADGSHNGDATHGRTNQNSEDKPPIGPIPSDHKAEMQQIEDEIYHVLQELRKAQESEYQIAEETLNSQKELLNELYKELEKEKIELSRRTSGADANDLITAVLERSNRIKKEVVKLKQMEEVAKGFGRTPRGILEEHFNLQVDDKVNPAKF